MIIILILIFIEPLGFLIENIPFLKCVNLTFADVVVEDKTFIIYISNIEKPKIIFII